MTPQELADNAVDLPAGVVFAARVSTVKAPNDDVIYILSVVFQVEQESKAFKQNFAIDEELAQLMGLNQITTDEEKAQ